MYFSCSVSLFRFSQRKLYFLFIYGLLTLLFNNVVTMQAQRTAPPDLQIKDKFLVQTTVVPSGTSDEGSVPSFVSMQQFMFGLV